MERPSRRILGIRKREVKRGAMVVALFRKHDAAQVYFVPARNQTPGSGADEPAPTGTSAGPTKRGTSRSGMGAPAKRRRQGLASQRAQRPDHETRALSVAMP